jgi:hypothetical protein
MDAEEQHNVFNRVTALPEQTISLSAACFERKYNSIDADISAACKSGLAASANVLESAWYFSCVL